MVYYLPLSCASGFFNSQGLLEGRVSLTNVCSRSQGFLPFENLSVSLGMKMAGSRVRERNEWGSVIWFTFRMMDHNLPLRAGLGGRHFGDLHGQRNLPIQDLSLDGFNWKNVSQLKARDQGGAGMSPLLSLPGSTDLIFMGCPPVCLFISSMTANTVGWGPLVST